MESFVRFLRGMHTEGLAILMRNAGYDNIVPMISAAFVELIADAKSAKLAKDDDSPLVLLQNILSKTPDDLADELSTESFRELLGLISMEITDAMRSREDANELWAVHASEAAYWIDCADVELRYLRSRRSPASEMAHKRHKENRELISFATEYWSKNIDKNLPAVRAASILESVVPLSHKKLAEIVSEAKKSLKTGNT